MASSSFPVKRNHEVLITCHICHPSLAERQSFGNCDRDGARDAAGGAEQRRLGYRFLFLPATIGAITWLARNEAMLDTIKHGLVLTCLGDAGAFHYKQSREEGRSSIVPWRMC